MGNVVLVSAAGTASAYHLVRTLRSLANGNLTIAACDINPRHLVACADLCDQFLQVPPVADGTFLSQMVSHFRSLKCEVYVPLIDQDLAVFPRDSSQLRELGCRSTAPPGALVEMVTSKSKCHAWLNKKGLATPRQFALNELQDDRTYFVKPNRGFGSRGVRTLTGREARESVRQDELVQEYCPGPEVTVEIYVGQAHVDTLCRDRIETKAGVCTKARVYSDPELHELVLKLVENEPWPVASCIQFMKNDCEQWVVTDVNLRLGAGTAMCSAVGWDLARAAAATWLQLDPDPERFLKFEGPERYVVRAYSEIVTA